MRFQQPESAGPASVPEGPEKPFKEYKVQSRSLPFGQSVPLEQIGGPTYVTAQTLVQQVAFSLSDRLWTYSPDTFDLDAAVKSWEKEGAKNAYGYTTGVQSMQVRSGAASIALGYIFSKDFDLKKRHVPQSIIATSSSLQYLRSALDQLSLLYNVANPFVAHVAAVDYAGGETASLVTDYVSGLVLAEELGMGVVSSFSAYESQHMSLLATLFAGILPTMHLYDGITVGRETTRVIDVLDQGGLHRSYEAIKEEATKTVRKNADNDTKAVGLLKAFNGEMGTDYHLFEYKGHEEPEAVLVVFGTVESSLASQVAVSLQADGVAIGVVSVRVYRPFVEEEFLKAVPKSAKTVGVLGQVQNSETVADPGFQSNLYSDVLAAFTFGSDLPEPPKIIDVKYPRNQAWKPVTIAAAFQLLVSRPLLGDEPEAVPGSEALQIVDPATTQQYTFWDVDESLLTECSTPLSQALSKDSASNVTISTKYDNLLQGGVQRTDIRKSKRTLEASYSVDSADTAFVGDESILKAVNVLGSVKAGGNVILRLPGVKDEDLEKKLPVAFRKDLSDNGVKLFILDPQAVDELDEDEQIQAYLIQVAFLRVALPSLEDVGIQKLALINGNAEILNKLSDALEKSLRTIEVPEDWSVVEGDVEPPKLPTDIHTSSFTPFDKIEPEAPTLLKDWKTIAKSLAFKEAYGAKPELKPELTTQTWTVSLMEHRRLTPLTYDRNIMHLEFDLSNSGMKYNIGDSLGIHPRNDKKEIEDFIRTYGLNPKAVVEAEARDSPQVLRARTVYQALIEDVDIFGQPGRQFYEQLADFATNTDEQKTLLALGGSEGATEFKRRAEVDTITYADILEEFPSAHPEFHDLIRLVAPLKRREYSIASCQKVTPNTVSLMIVTVNWVDPRGRDRFGLATRYLDALNVGDSVTVSLKPSVMKLPPKPTDPIIMAGLGTGLAPFRAFVQHRAWEKEQGTEIGPVMLYMGSRHQREEYCYGEEWEAYRDAGVVSLLSCAFSRDQPQKIYIQDRMRQTGKELEGAYVDLPGAFYLCGPTWPVPDVTNVLEEVIEGKGRKLGKKVKGRKEIEKLKDEGRYVLEVY
ncbi:MAG: hypothetical protein MMC23_003606 [Stictis urceolatum]|nr:hypothetical protein [Stictis urceolata]